MLFRSDGWTCGNCAGGKGFLEPTGTVEYSAQVSDAIDNTGDPLPVEEGV